LLPTPAAVNFRGSSTEVAELADSLRTRRTAGAIFADSFRYYAKDPYRFAALGILSATVSVLTTALELLTHFNNVLGFAMLLLLPAVTSGVNGVVNATFVSHLLDLYRDRRPGFSADVKNAIRLWPKIFPAVARGWLIVIGLMVTVLGFPWATRRTVRWMFVTQTATVDLEPQEDALNRSADLVLGHWWSTCGRLLLIGAVPWVVRGPFIVAPYVAQHRLLFLLLGASTTLLTAPYLAIGMTLIYFDLKARKAVAISSGDDLPA
jgi:hypothetical protein